MLYKIIHEKDTQRLPTRIKPSSFFIFVLALALNSFLGAQNIFVAKTLSQINMTPDKQERLNMLLNLPRDGDLKYASVNNFDTWFTNNNGQVVFNIPGLEGTFTASLMQVNFESEEKYTYIGKVAGSGNMNFTIGRDEEGIAGYVALATAQYNFYPLGGDEVAFIKQPPLPTGNDCGMPSNSSSQTVVQNYCEPPTNSCYGFVDVLVLVHPSAFGTVPVGFGNLASTQINSILLNSGIPNKEVRVRRANLPASVLFALSPGDPWQDIIDLKNNSQIQQIRGNTGADMVVLLIGSPYMTLIGTVAGIAAGNGTNDPNQLAPGVEEDGAYAIVASGFAVGPTFTLAHELAHNWGARHNRIINGGNDDAFDCAHGLRFIGGSGNTWITTMAVLGGVARRIPHFSNPAIAFDGVATGVAGGGNTSADNARKIRNAFCEVDSYEDPYQLYAQIEGPSSLCLNGQFNYKAWVTPGSVQGSSPSWSCKWDYAFHPGGPYTTLPVIGCTANVSGSLTPSSTMTIYLRLTVTPNAGAVFSTTKAIYVAPPCTSPSSASADRGEAEYENKDFL